MTVHQVSNLVNAHFNKHKIYFLLNGKDNSLKECRDLLKLAGSEPAKDFCYQLESKIHNLFD